MAKQYGTPENYEAKLERVMGRLGVESYDYDWSRHECWVEFTYKGERYRFAHSLNNARAHGVELRYGSDAFAQVVLSLEDLARMVERGIYDLGTWVAGLKFLPEAKSIENCFFLLGFTDYPTIDELNAKYRKLAKVMHPDSGGNETEFVNLNKNYEQCRKLLQQKISEMKSNQEG